MQILLLLPFYRAEQSIRFLECIGLKGIRDAIIASGEEFDGDYLCNIDMEEDFNDFLSEVKLEVTKWGLSHGLLTSFTDVVLIGSGLWLFAYLVPLLLSSSSSPSS